MSKSLLNSKVFVTLIGLLCPLYKPNAQNLVTNGSFGTNLNAWSTQTTNCNASNTDAFVQFNNSTASLPTSWNGTAYLQQKVLANNTDIKFLSQMIEGLVSGDGKTLTIKLDLLLAESNNITETANDHLTLEVWFANTKYATVVTTSQGYYNSSGNLGIATVSYHNGAFSNNYANAGSILTINGTVPPGVAPHTLPKTNANWDINIPWLCNMPASGALEFRVKSNIICGASNANIRLDELAIDNVVIEALSIPATPALLNSKLMATSCNQNIFNLNTITSALPSCPVANPQGLEYSFYLDQDLTQKIANPATYNFTGSALKLFVVLNSKASLSTNQIKSTTVQSFDLVRNPIIFAGQIAGNQEICSGVVGTSTTNIFAHSVYENGAATFSWEYATYQSNNTLGLFGPTPVNSSTSTFIPSGFSTFDRTITKIALRRRITSSIGSDVCVAFSNNIDVLIDPCEPTTSNLPIPNIVNPGGNLYTEIPLSQFNGSVSTRVPARKINRTRIVGFPINATSMRISGTSANGRVQSTVYCGTPAAPGCIGTPMPTGGITMPADEMGRPINNMIEVDPDGAGSFQVDIPYIVIDNENFTSTNANASIQLTVVALPINLISFEVKKLDQFTNELTWKTAEEKNFSHFEVEQKSSNNSYNSIGKVSSNESKYYKYLAKSTNVVDYYRLKMVDLDGKIAYSKIISIENQITNFTILGNPSTSTIKIKQDLPNGEYQYRVYDTTGRLLYQQTINTAKVEPEIELKTKLTSGSYIIELNHLKKGKISGKKFVVY